MTQRAPVRLERDGGLASMVLDDPPLNLFGPHTYEALMACLEEVEGFDARALVWRAEGDAFTGGADVNVFNRVVEALESGDGTHEIAGFGQLLGAVKRLEDLPIPTLALVHGLCLMAFAGRAVLASREIDDPAAVRRLAVRFSRPMTPGEAITTRVLETENGVVRFDATNGADEVVLKDGLAELSGAAPAS